MPTASNGSVIPLAPSTITRVSALDDQSTAAAYAGGSSRSAVIGNPTCRAARTAYCPACASCRW